MPKIVPSLADKTIKNAKARDKAYKLADGGGLYLEVMPTGAKLWRMKFKRASGKESRLAFGAYDDVSLADARAKRDAARKQMAGGVDPAQAKRIEKQQKATLSKGTV